MTRGASKDLAPGGAVRTLLLGGWEDIADDVRRLAAALARTPDECRCGHGRAHLAGSCPCCMAHDPSRRDACVDCGEVVDRLRPKVDQTTADTLRYLPALIDLPSFKGRTDPMDVDAVRTGLADLSHTFDRLTAAAGEFERGCAAVHLKAVKARAAELSQLVAQVHAALGLKRVRVSGR